MRLSDERLDEIALNVLQQKRHEIITGEVGRIVLKPETAAALVAEVRALRECKDLVAIVSRNRHRLGECLFVARASDPMVIDPGWPSSSVAVRIPGDMIRAALAGVRALEDKP